MKNALVLTSGGVDSTTALALAIEKYGSDHVIALSISYGQKHTKELEAAKAVAAHYGVEQRFLDLALIFKDSNCSLLEGSTEEIPEASYAEQIAETHGETPVSTYVPSATASFCRRLPSPIALSNDCEVKSTTAPMPTTQPDLPSPDCSPIFNNAMNTAIYEGSGHQLRIEAPFVNQTKADIVALGLKLGVPYTLTWSCYEGRREAMRQMRHLH